MFKNIQNKINKVIQLEAEIAGVLLKAQEEIEAIEADIQIYAPDPVLLRKYNVALHAQKNYRKCKGKSIEEVYNYLEYLFKREEEENAKL